MAAKLSRNTQIRRDVGENGIPAGVISICTRARWNSSLRLSFTGAMLEQPAEKVLPVSRHNLTPAAIKLATSRDMVSGDLASCSSSRVTLGLSKQLGAGSCQVGKTTLKL
jgi:hypothetical protein